MLPHVMIVSDWLCGKIGERYLPSIHGKKLLVKMCYYTNVYVISGNFLLFHKSVCHFNNGRDISGMKLEYINPILHIPLN